MIRVVRRHLRFAMSGGAWKGALLAAAMLGVGIGATTALYAAIDTLFIHPLPFPSADRLTFITLANREDRAAGRSGSVADLALFQAWSREHPGLDGIGGFQGFSLAMHGEGAAQQVEVVAASAGLFPMLGVAPAIGRTFARHEDLPGAPPVVVLSDRFWRSQYRADAGVLGRSIALGDRVFEIVGVMPPGFRIPNSMTETAKDKAEVWIALGNYIDRWPPNTSLPVAVIGRLRPGVNESSAATRLDVVAQRERRDTTVGRSTRHAYVVPVRDVIVQQVRRPVWFAFAGASLLLLVVSVNAATLQRARIARRGKQLALRMSLGAGDGHILRLLVFDAVVIAVLALIAGLVVAAAVLPLVVQVYGSRLPDLGPLRIDGHVALFGALTAVAAALLIGVTPAIGALRPLRRAAFQGWMARGGELPNPGRRGAALVAIEVASALLLVSASALLLATYRDLARSDLGFRTTDVTYGLVHLRTAQYRDREAQLRFASSLEAALARTVPVGTTALATGAPVLGGPELGISTEVAPAAPIDMPAWAVTPAYFDLLGIPLLAGNLNDFEGLPGTAVVDSVAASVLFPGRSALGRAIVLGSGGDRATIVGVVGNVVEYRYPGPNAPQTRVTRPHVYVPFGTGPGPFWRLFMLAAGPRTGSAVPAWFGEAVAVIDPDLPVLSAWSMTAEIEFRASRERFLGLLTTGFCVLSLAAAAAGVYAMVVQVVERRRREIGIRIALGGRTRHVLRTILSKTLRPVLWGVLIGGLASLALGRVLRSVLVNSSTTDVGTFVGLSSVAVVLVAITAACIPTFRAAGTDPRVVLAQE